VLLEVVVVALGLEVPDDVADGAHVWGLVPAVQDDADSLPHRKPGRRSVRHGSPPTSPVWQRTGPQAPPCPVAPRPPPTAAARPAARTRAAWIARQGRARRPGRRPSASAAASGATARRGR